MKHIFKRALALTMAASFFAVSAFAAPTFSKAAYNAETGILDVEVAGYEEGKDATILVLKDGVTPAAATNNDIIFIDQVTLTGKTVAEYTAPIKVRANAVGATGVNVYVGGDDITTAVPYVKDGETGVSEIKLQEDPAPADTYTIEIPDGTYKTIDAAKAAAVVKKNGTAVTEGLVIETVAGATENTYTVNVKVDDKVVATTTVTITPDTPSTGKTGIKGVVKCPSYDVIGAYDPAPYASVLVTKMSVNDKGKESFEDEVVAKTFADADGNFEVELPTGMYRVVVNFVSLVDGEVYTYNPTVVTKIEVKDADTTLNTIASEGQTDKVVVEEPIEGDANHDGVITRADINAAKTAFANAK